MDDTPASPDVDPTAPPPDGTAAAPAATSAPAAPAAPWEGPSPDVVAWLLVNWHNKHPLARRIGIADVHTVGAVALPFMAQALPKEPSLEAAAAPAETAPPSPAKRRLPWQRKPAGSGPRPAWVDEFIPGLKTSAVAAMALDHGFTAAPDELPLRRVEIDERALAADTNQAGAWPMELVLLSAAFDAGPARRRVLVGRRDRVLGRRALDPARLGVTASMAALVLIAAVWALWPSSRPSEELAAQAAAEAASAASAAAAASAASAALAQAALEASAASGSASAPTAAASDPLTAASAAASEVVPSPSASAASSAAVPATPPSAPMIPSIRPTLQSGVERAQREQAAAAAAKAASAPDAAKPAASAPETERRVSVDDAGLGNLMKRDAAPGGKLVALVGPAQKSKADAEAQLARMREMIGQTLGGNAVPNGEVFQTKDGWRAAVWPFGSREEAQLINATLLARGIRGTRAVDF
ncbi:hypothetical protein CS062_11240 [Roseateles chitinivorans]|uniref:SPOR domain-containing protein n=1 Tax=Roseateles chitinivorans TaxID=2917965 RepID=A0A2G9C9S7_9BURK|nr:hypothetical protein [Roseateles chitinivorans]PIM53163.1 hypothetical protein CS062_11240 [Roseateles chitinivorans]